MDINIVNEVQELFQAQSHLYHQTYNFIGSASLKTAINLGIPDKIYNHGRPITIPELVLALQINSNKSDHLRRLMRLLVHTGIFVATKICKDDKKEEEVGYDLTPSSRLLVKAIFPTLSPYVQTMLHPAFLHTPEFLVEWFYKNDPTPFHTAYGTSLWGYLGQNQEFNGLFNEAMIGDSMLMNLMFKDCKTVFEGVNSLVDIGGGKGAVAKLITELVPNLQCTVLELPHVIENIPDTDKVKFVGGDMFECVIPPADAILFKIVLHIFSDEECVKVLKKCREAISSKGKKGKVIIIDIVINEMNDKKEQTEAKLFFDVLMVAMVTGKEREEKEWEKLFLVAGFSHYKITPIFGMRSLIEVYP